MVRPAAVYNKARFTRNYESLGRVIAVLCKNAHITKDDLTDEEKSSLEEVENENEEMDRAIDSMRMKAAERQRKRRQSQSVTACHAMSRDVTVTSRDNAMSRDVTRHTSDTYIHTNIHTNEQTNTNRSEPDTRACARTREGVSGSASVRLNVFGMSGDEFFGGSHGTLELCKAALGNGFWAKAIRKLGDGKVLEELWAFVQEVKQGEQVNNPGAAMTERFKKMGVR